MSRNYDNFADLITFSRASQSTVVDSDGTLKYAAHNLVTYSEDISQWSQTNTTVTTNNITAPDGTSTADSMTIVNNLSRVQVALSLPADTYTFEVWLKSDDDINQLRLLSQDDSGTNYTTLISITGGAGWVKFTATHTYADTITKYQIRGSSGTTDALHVWGAHLYKSDKPMQNNPAQSDPNLATYVPTTSAAVYQPRIDFDAVTGDRKGLLIEEARTNAFDKSEDFTSPTFALTNVTVTSNQGTAPDGTNNADKVVAGFATQCFLLKNTAITSGDTHTLSVFAKADGLNFIQITGSTGFPTDHQNYNLSTGALASSSSTLSSSIEDFGNGWYRIALTLTATSTVSGGRFVIALMSGDDGRIDSDGTSNLSGTDGVLLFGAQFEEGAFPTSYIPTSGSTATRAADVASIATSAFGYNQDEGTLVTEAQTFLANNSHRIISINDGSSSNRIILMAHTTNHLFVGVGGATQGFCDAGGYTSNVFTKHAAAYQEDHFAACIDAGTVATDSSGTVPTVNVMNIGSALLSSFGFLNGHIKKLQYFPRRLSDTELQEITS